MTKEEIEQHIEGCTLTRSENNGFWHVRVSRINGNQPYRYSTTLPDNPSHETIAFMLRDIDRWWTDTIADQLPSGPDAQPVEHKEV